MKLNNKYYLLRHGEALSNVRQVTSSWPETFENPLTEKGREQVQTAAKELEGKHIEMIFASDLLRTKQTAGIVGQILNVVPKLDIRLRETGFGELNGKPAEELLYGIYIRERAKGSVQNNEPYENILRRLMEFFEEINSSYSSKNILIISHQAPLWVLENWIRGKSVEEAVKYDKTHKRIGKGEIRELE